MFGLTKKQITIFIAVLVLAILLTYFVPRIVGWQKGRWQDEAFDAGRKVVINALLSSFRAGQTANITDGDDIYILTARLKPKENEK